MRKLQFLSPLVLVAACGVESADRPPTVSAPPLVTREDTPAILTLTTDGDPAAMTVTAGSARHGRLDGSRMQWLYTPAADFAGTDVATITVSDGVRTTITRVPITVTPVDDAPVAGRDTFTARQDIPLRITTAALVSNDRDADGDELAVTAVSPGRDGSVALVDDQVVLVMPPGWNGVTSFAYTVSDGAEAAPGVVTVIVGAADQAPTAEPDQVATEEDTYLSVAAASLLANDSDPNGADLFVTAVGGAEHGTAVFAGGAVVFVPEADYHGHAHFQYTVSDGALTSVGEVDVVIGPVNDAPIAKPDAFAADEDIPLVIATADLTANDGDADGDRLAVTEVSGAYGGWVALEGGLVTFTPGPEFHGAAGFTYVVSDGAATATAAVAITVGAGNDGPAAADDVAATSEDTAVEIPFDALTANDADGDGDPLTITSVSDVSGGSAVLSGGPVVKFTPAPDFNGTAYFQYVISDGAASALATVAVEVTPANDAPIARADQAVTPEDVTVVIPISELVDNDLDVDGDPLTVSQILGSTAGGVATLGGDAVTFKPDSDYHGHVEVYVRVSDGAATSDSKITIDVVAMPDAPIAAGVNTATTVDQPISVVLAATDPDGDAVTLSIASAPTHGIVTGLGALVTYVPDPGFTGVDWFTYRADDGHGGVTIALVTIVVDPAITCVDGAGQPCLP